MTSTWALLVEGVIAELSVSWLIKEHHEGLSREGAVAQQGKPRLSYQLANRALLPTGIQRGSPGVMCPSAVAECRRIDHNEPPNLPEFFINRRSTDLILYDTIRVDANRNADTCSILRPYTKRNLATGSGKIPADSRSPNRKASVDAVVRDLELLVLRTRK